MYTLYCLCPLLARSGSLAKLVYPLCAVAVSQIINVVSEGIQQLQTVFHIHQELLCYSLFKAKRK